MHVWVEQQANLKDLRSPAEAVFFVMGCAQPTEYGLTINACLVGAKTGPAQKALAPIFALSADIGKRAILHLCSSRTCVSSDSKVVTDYKRVHAIAIQIMYQPDVTDR